MSELSRPKRQASKTRPANRPTHKRSFIPNDIRRTYPRIFEQLFNGTERSYAEQQFQKYCTPDCIMVTRSAHNPFGPNYREVHGIESIISFVDMYCEAIPDGLMSFHDTRFFRQPHNESVIFLTYTVQGHLLFIVDTSDTQGTEDIDSAVIGLAMLQQNNDPNIGAFFTGHNEIDSNRDSCDFSSSSSSSSRSGTSTVNGEHEDVRKRKEENCRKHHGVAFGEKLCGWKRTHDDGVGLDLKPLVSAPVPAREDMCIAAKPCLDSVGISNSRIDASKTARLAGAVKAVFEACSTDTAASVETSPTTISLTTSTTGTGALPVGESIVSTEEAASTAEVVGLTAVGSVSESLTSSAVAASAYPLGKEHITAGSSPVYETTSITPVWITHKRSGCGAGGGIGGGSSGDSSSAGTISSRSLPSLSHRDDQISALPNREDCMVVAANANFYLSDKVAQSRQTYDVVGTMTMHLDSNFKVKRIEMLNSFNTSTHQLKKSE